MSSKVDYGEVRVGRKSYLLGPEGPVDPSVRAKLRWGTDSKCLACDCELGIKGGFGGTDLCGPCCTGDAATLDEYGVSW